MSLSAPNTPDFPLVSLRPVTNHRHAWCALLLGAHPAVDVPALPRLFDECGLDAAIDGVPCVAPLADSATFGGDLVRQLPAERIVLLIPMSCCCDPAAAADLERLQRLGYRLMAQGVPETGQKLPSAVSALAIEIGSAAAEHAGLPGMLKQLPGPHLALGVDSHTSLARAFALGCSHCAGEYPLHPLHAPQQGQSRALLLKLLALVTSDADSHAIELLLKQAPTLSYQLLKLVNSVSFSLNTKIANFGHAITLLGRRQLQRWLQLLLYAQQGGEQRNPLLACAALRASLTEALSQASGGDREEQERAYMVGMFSLLDVLFAMPMVDIVASLNLAEDVVAAIMQRSGRLGALLAIVEQSERTPTPDFAGQLAALVLTPAGYCRSLAIACRWTIQVSQGN